MANHGLSRPEGSITRTPPVPHDRFAPDLLSGTLFLSLETPQGQFVSPGTGRLSLSGEASGEVVAQEAARSAGTPVLPGSGIKGAVRTLFELLSSSCNPFVKNNGCTRDSCCEACSLFGLMGWSGRVSFSDAVPQKPDSVQAKVEKVPIPWLPHPEKTNGAFRLYDLHEAVQLDPERRVWHPRPKDLAREVFAGKFVTRLAFRNASREELGRLLLCMGMGADPLTKFLLRLGGVKYDGKGAVQVSAQSLQLVAPKRKSLEKTECDLEVAGWIEAARQSDWNAKFWSELENVARTLAIP